jgi:cellulose synthase/poly-beta-1,6-N-acetylglucosamine synthase-like glycosyltransferase
MVQAYHLGRYFVLPTLRKAYGRNTQSADLGPVSVIVVAKNEKPRLEALLPALFQQDYPQFEVIVVDNQSWDGSYELLHEWKAIHPNLQIVAVAEHIKAKPGKKLALTLAIKKAANDILIFTDADCVPRSAQWLRQVAASYSPGVEMVIGYSPYSAKPGILNPLVRYEAFFVAWQYISFALAGRPYMGVGRNLSYRKTAFMANKGFANNLNVSFGDDDLMVQEMAKPQNTAVVLHPDSHVWSIPKHRLADWLRQKKRHLSAGAHYRGKFRLALGTIWLARFAYYLTGVAFLLSGQLHVLGLVLMALPILAAWGLALALHRAHRMFSLWWAYPAFDLPYQVLIYPILGLFSLIKPQKDKW